MKAFENDGAVCPCKRSLANPFNTATQNPWAMLGRDAMEGGPVGWGSQTHSKAIWGIQVVAPWVQQLHLQHWEKPNPNKGSYHDKRARVNQEATSSRIQMKRLQTASSQPSLIPWLLPVWPRVSNCDQGLPIHTWSFSNRKKHRRMERHRRGVKTVTYFFPTPHSLPYPHSPTACSSSPYIISLVRYLHFGRISLFQGLSAESRRQQMACYTAHLSTYSRQ